MLDYCEGVDGPQSSRTHKLEVIDFAKPVAFAISMNFGVPLDLSLLLSKWCFDRILINLTGMCNLLF